MVTAMTADGQTSAPWNDPDFVDRVFEYLLREFPQIAGHECERVRSAMRFEFAGDKHYIKRQSQTDKERRKQQILSMFNGRNATEIARALQIGRTTVYRTLKQAGRKPS